LLSTYRRAFFGCQAICIRAVVVNNCATLRARARQSSGNPLEADESCIATSQTTGEIPGVDSRSWCDVEGHAKVVDVIPGHKPKNIFAVVAKTASVLPLVLWNQLMPIRCHTLWWIFDFARAGGE